MTDMMVDGVEAEVEGLEAMAGEVEEDTEVVGEVEEEVGGNLKSDHVYGDKDIREELVLYILMYATRSPL